MIPAPTSTPVWGFLLRMARRFGRWVYGDRSPVEATPDPYPHPIRGLAVRRLDDGEALEPGERLVIGFDPATENAELVACAVPDGQAPPDSVEIELRPAPRPLIHWAPVGHRFTDCCGRLVDSINPPDECHTGPTAATCNGGRPPW